MIMLAMMEMAACLTSSTRLQLASGDCLFLSLCALDPASLLAARAVCVSWRHAAVMVLRSPGWQADNLTARQLVLADAPAAAEWDGVCD